MIVIAIIDGIIIPSINANVLKKILNCLKISGLDDLENTCLVTVLQPTLTEQLLCQTNS